MKVRTVRGLAAGLGAAGAIGAASVAAEAVRIPSGPPPSWESLVPCTQKADTAEGYACFVAALRGAGFKPDTEAAAAAHRKSFGLNILPGKKEKPEKPEKAPRQAKGQAPSEAPAGEDENRITVKIVEVAYTKPLDQMLIVTADGAVWKQTDTIALNFRPSAGQTMEISKTRFGGYFCKFNRTDAVRCERKN